MIIYFATWWDDGGVFNKLKANNRLLSYFFLRDKPHKRIERYFNTGEYSDKQTGTIKHIK